MGSAGLLAGCCVDLPVHAALYTNREKCSNNASFLLVVLLKIGRLPGRLSRFSDHLQSDFLANLQ